MEDNATQDITRKFDQEENIGSFRDVILSNFSEVNECYVYRTCQNLPCCKNDQTPLIVRKQNQQTGKIPRKYSNEELEKMSDQKKLKEVCHYALSVNDTAENSIENAKRMYRKLLSKGLSAEELNAYADSRGRYVGLFKITSDVGMMTGFDNGHANLLLYEGVNLEEHRIKDFHEIIDYENDTEN